MRRRPGMRCRVELAVAVTLLLGAAMNTPVAKLPRGNVPEMSVPMAFPSILLAVAVEPEMNTPNSPFLEMTLPAPVEVPPIELESA